MTAVLTMTEPRKRKSKGRRTTTTVTFRISPTVKDSLAEVAEITTRSENHQAEFFLKVGYLYSQGINTYGMSETQIAQKFDEITTHLQETEED